MKYQRVLLLCILISGPVFAQNFASNPNPGLQLDSTAPGESPAHHLNFTAQAGELETYRARIRYPGEFGFNGFHPMGPVNTAVGRYAFDLNNDDLIDISFDIRSLNDNSAYIDLLTDGEYNSGIEPIMEYLAGNFQLTLPFGGDLNSTTLLVPWTSQVTLTLFAGLIVNPATTGSYDIQGMFFSVDPDTDGADDDNGTAPQQLSRQLSIDIMPNEILFSDGFETD